MKTEVFFRIVIKPFVLSDKQSDEVQSATEYRTRKEAKAEAESAAFSPDDYKIVRCERKVL